MNKSTLRLAILAILAVACANTNSLGVIIKQSEDDSRAQASNANVLGRITDSESGKGIAGVVVSDGLQCVVTDAEGNYSMESDLEVAKNVFPVIPSGYEASFAADGTFNTYAKLRKDSTNRCDFKLTHAENPDEYTMLFLGDPQVMSSRPHSIESWEYVNTRLAEIRRSTTGALYQILLGDMVVNEIEVPGKAENYLAILAKGGIKSFHVPGNHDHVQSAMNYYDSIIKYSDYFGPYNYAVNIGKVHYIFLDSVAWNEKKYSTGFNQEALSFLVSYIRHVPQDEPLMICTHCPVTRTYGRKYPSSIGYNELISALRGYSVTFWYGHIHFNSFSAYDSSTLAEYAPGLKALDSNVVGRCGGSWACSGPVLRDGCPRGVVEMKVKGTKVEWHWKSIDPDYPDDFNVYLPGQFKGEGFSDDSALYCNVYLWDQNSPAPELWVDGTKAGDFRLCTCASYPAVADPLYAYYYPGWADSGVTGFRKEPPMDYDNDHLFSIIPPSGCTKAEIRVADRWGNVLVREVCW